MIDRFEGFPSEMIDFLWDLRFHNNKEWFDQNRDRYKILLKEPMDQFGREMAARFSSIDPEITAIPVVSRINRDIRFSKDKSPYRDRKWVVFKQDTGNWKEKPVYYFEVRPECYCYGMGFYCCKPETMKRFRQKIDAAPSVMEELIDRYCAQKEFVLDGDIYKKKFQTEYSEKMMDWYQRRSIVLQCEKPLGHNLYNREILDEVEKGFRFLVPYHRYLISTVS
ncbi:MAG: DUF2461 domain-containing protein [Clostridiales bacterium]|nr:DUF2461 domain-containing protein [Clostridiales bacterium]